MRRTPLVLLAALALLVTLTGCGGGGKSDSAKTSSGPCSYRESGKAARSVKLPPAKPVSADTATISTSAGDIKIMLDSPNAPCTVGSFLSLAKQGFYDKTDCHRLTTQGFFVLQCGDPTGSGSGGPGYSYDDELGKVSTQLGCTSTPCVYPAGTVAMANSGRNTNGSQFFLVYQSSTLDPAYTVFGRMDAAGLKVVQNIAKAGVDPARAPAPKTKVTIDKVDY